MAESALLEIINKYNKDKYRLLDLLLDIQNQFGYISNESVSEISRQFEISQADILETLSFYHFFHTTYKGKYTIYLNDGIVANMMGRKNILDVFEKEIGCKIGSLSQDNQIGLFSTPCIGMCDQEPAAIINNLVFSNLTEKKVKIIVKQMRQNITVENLASNFENESISLKDKFSTVNDNIRKKGPILFSNYEISSAVKKAISTNPELIIEELKKSNLKGRGGAGFPTGMKWDFCRKVPGELKFIICNADEGEPGTFKDRAILTRLPHLLFDGMTIAGYTLGALHGIIYLRYEYSYLKNYLEQKLKEYRAENRLGQNILGKEGFYFDIRIQLGAGSYVCGEETALIESLEGKRGEPRNRPPFPASHGYMQKPSTINNVETLSLIPFIINLGADWFKSFGTKESSGTKLLSISGDCDSPGIYEIEFGMTINEMLEFAGAKDTQAVVVAGPSGNIISPKQFERKICFEDLATGGAMIIIGNKRNLLKDIIPNFLDFFIDESCGSCTPCRVITVHAKKRLQKILNGHGTQEDINDLKSWGRLMQNANRCGLGKTALNPILTTIENFPELYKDLLNNKEYISEFNLKAATAEYEKITKQ